MTNTVNIHIKRLVVQAPPPAPKLRQQTVIELIKDQIAGVDCAADGISFGTARRYGIIQSHARVAVGGTYLAAYDTTTPHVAVVDNATGLMWSVESLGDPSDDDSGLPHAECEKRCAELRLLGFDDWRLPTRAELAALIDDTRHDPAIDTALFPRVKPRWHWTSTPAAWSSASAWYVGFYNGVVDDLHRRNLNGFALAVRRAGQ